MAGKNQDAPDVYTAMLGALPQFNLPQVNGEATRMAVLPVSLWLQWQADLWKAVSPASAEWIKRRQEAVAETLQTVEKLAGCKDMTEAAEIQRAWLENEMRRLESDMRMLGAQASALPEQFAEVGRRAASASGDTKSGGAKGGTGQ